VKSSEELFEIYLQSVGRGAVLLLNVPPDRRGHINEHDILALQGFKQILNDEFSTNMMDGAKVRVSSVRGDSKTFDANQLIDNIDDTYWATDDSITSGTIEIGLKNEHTINYIVLHEYLHLGQRVKAFNIEVEKNDRWIRVADATTMGVKRIIRIDKVVTGKIRVNITDAKACLTVSGLEIY
jgi:alpha-L-fucosidase